MYKVVFDVSDINKVDQVLSNILNVLKDFDYKDIEIELVSYAESIIYFLKENNPDMKRINEILDNGVKINICSNSMRANNVTEDMFDMDINIVPAGIGYIIRKQGSDYIYIKP